jgi:hypothetical protein
VVEHVTFNHGVEGSSPSALTKQTYFTATYKVHGSYRQASTDLRHDIRRNGCPQPNWLKRVISPFDRHFAVIQKRENLMTKQSVLTFAVALAGMLSAAPAHAQATRTFVSPTGNDASPTCSLTAPCRTFAAAYTLTNAGGEIAVLGTAGYGSLTINKAISIFNGGGFEAGIAIPSGGTGITINASADDAVSLRGLSIDGAGVGQTGITFTSGKSLTVTNCVIRHMTSDGIDFFSTTATSDLTISDSLVADNGHDGIVVAPTGSATAVFNRIEANRNALRGINVNGTSSSGTNTVNATVVDSVAAGNSGIGVLSASGSSGAPTIVTVSHSVAANNKGTGVEAGGSGAILRLANSTVTGNLNGWVPSAGVVQSYGDNYIDGNTGNETAPPAVARK